MKNIIMFNSERIEARLSIISVIWFRLNIEETTEHKLNAKYHKSSSIITGRLIKMITMMTNTPRVFFIMRKLENTDEIASPTPPPTIGTKAPEMNLIPFSATLSDDVARML